MIGPEWKHRCRSQVVRGDRCTERGHSFRSGISMGAAENGGKTAWRADGPRVSMRIRVEPHILIKWRERSCRAVATLYDAEVCCGDARGTGHQQVGREKYGDEASHTSHSRCCIFSVYYPLAISSTGRILFAWARV